MKENLTELVLILDRSGSMAGLEADTIGGFNAMITRQKAEPGDALISTVLFDDNILGSLRFFGFSRFFFSGSCSPGRSLN